MRQHFLPTSLLERPDATRPALPLHSVAEEEHERSAASGAMYVYLNSGAVDAVPSVECLAVDERTVTLNCTGEPRRYSRSAVYMISRELISPPMQF